MEDAERKTSSDFYMFKMPTASSLHTPLDWHETLSLLREINAFQPALRRLPEELLLHINNNIHTNCVYQMIRSTWSPIVNPIDDIWKWDSIHNYKFRGWYELPLARARIDQGKKRFYISEPGPIPPEEQIFQPGWYQKYLAEDIENISITYSGLHKMISSADLLYRVRCFFPEIYIDPEDGYKTMWLACLRHNPTGMGLGLTEWKGKALLRVDWGESDTPLDKMPRGRYEDMSSEEKNFKDQMRKLGTPFSEDAVVLLNALVGSLDDNGNDHCEPRRFLHFHPAADANIPTSADGHYLVIPKLRDPPSGWAEEPYSAWESIQDVASNSLPNSSSILSALTYNVQSGQVEIASTSNTVALTRVISSSLLFYRLMCHFPIKNYGDCEFEAEVEPYPGEVDQGRASSVTSVWRVELFHRPTGACVIFMDDRGLFDIRAVGSLKHGTVEVEVEEVVMRDIVMMMNELCKEDPYEPDGF